jgi:hypothetical protein
MQTNSDATKTINNFAENVVFINSTYKKSDNGLKPLLHCAAFFSQRFFALVAEESPPPLRSIGKPACNLHRRDSLEIFKKRDCRFGGD